MELACFFLVGLNKLLNKHLYYRYIEPLSRVWDNTVKTEEKLKSKKISSSYPYNWHTYSLHKLYHKVLWVLWQALTAIFSTITSLGPESLLSGCTLAALWRWNWRQVLCIGVGTQQWKGVSRTYRTTHAVVPEKLCIAATYPRMVWAIQPKMSHTIN